MNRGLFALLCAAMLLADPASARVVLVGVDGATWSVIDPLLGGRPLPSLLARLLSGAVRGRRPPSRGALRPADSGDDERYARLIPETMIGIDRAIGEIAGALGPEGAVEIAGARVPVSEIASADGFSATHHPIGILLAAGNPIRHLEAREKVSVLEVAPLLAYLAGTAIAEDLEGSLMEPWIRPEYLASHPPHRVKAAKLPRLPAWEGERASGADSDLIERLRSMGYIE